MSALSASATYRPRTTSGQFIAAKITPGVLASVRAAGQLVFDESQTLVHVRSGALKATGSVVIVQTDKTATARIVYAAAHAGYAEFGTGQRGAASPEKGPYPYDENWPGMVPIPYLRLALDTTREAVKAIFASEIALGLNT